MTASETLTATMAALATNPHNAVAHLDPAHVRAQSPPDGPLHGVPVAVKDLIDVAGLPTRCGSAVLADVGPANRDAEVIARLRAAGATIVAKTHTHEFAYGPTGAVNVDGACRNPHDPALITGGSSSGSAALVAAGVVALAVGTDTGCSVRTPAALCGVVGLKPAYHALPTTGVFPLSATCDHVGLLGVDPAIVGRAFAALSGRPARPRPVSELVVGVARDEYWAAHDPVITDAVAAAADALRDAGAEVRDATTPTVAELATCYPTIVGYEAMRTHRRWLDERPQDYQPATRDRLSAASEVTADAYAAALATRDRLGTDLVAGLTGVDVLLTPTTPIRATPIGADEITAPDGTVVAVRPALLSLCLPWNLVGLPALSVPAPDVPGLPAGIQLVGIGVDEATLLAAGDAVVGGRRIG